MTNIVNESRTFVQANLLNLTCDTMNVIELFTLYTTHASGYKPSGLREPKNVLINFVFGLKPSRLLFNSV